MNLHDYLEGAGRGSLSELARAIRAHAPDVSRWAGGDRPVPIDKCYAIEKATNCQVMRWDLHPDKWHLIWPELIGTDGAPNVEVEPTSTDAATL